MSKKVARRTIRGKRPPQVLSDGKTAFEADAQEARQGPRQIVAL